MRPVDLSEVVDLRRDCSPVDDDEKAGTPANTNTATSGAAALGLRRHCHRHVHPRCHDDDHDDGTDDEEGVPKNAAAKATTTTTFTLDGHPGCYLVPRALTLDEQRRWLQAAVTRLPDPPACTNHAAALGMFPGLWGAARRGEWLVSSPRTPEAERPVRAGAAEAVDGNGDVNGGGDGDTTTSADREGAPAPLPPHHWARLDPAPKRGDPACSLAAAHLLVFSLPYTLYPIPCTLYSVPYTLYPIPCTLYPIPCTLYPIPQTLNPIPYTLYPLPYTLYPIPYTLNPKP